MGRVLVITDREEIAEAARAAGARAIVSQRPAESGSDRVAHLLELDPEAARAEIVVDLQADEPLLEPAAIDAAVRALTGRPEADVSTLVRELRDGEAGDPAVVKVARAEDGRALWFSRAPIPHGSPTWAHVGLYVYRREAFGRFAGAAPTALERAERLEQLRALEIGLTIVAEPFDTRSIAVDRPDDVARVEAILAAGEPHARR